MSLLKGVFGIDDTEEKRELPAVLRKTQSSSPYDKVAGILGGESTIAKTPREKVEGILGASSKTKDARTKVTDILGSSNSGKSTAKDKVANMLSSGKSQGKGNDIVKSILSRNTSIKDVMSVGKRKTNINRFVTKPKPVKVNKPSNGNLKNKIKQQQGLSKFGDFDGDGVKNIMDCQPRNPREQGTIHKIRNFVSGRGYQEDLAMVDPKTMRIRNMETGKFTDKEDYPTTFAQDVSDLGSDVGGAVVKGAKFVGSKLAPKRPVVSDVVDSPEEIRNTETPVEAPKDVSLGKKILRGSKVVGEGLSQLHSDFVGATPFISREKTIYGLGSPGGSGEALGHKLAYLSGSNNYGHAQDMASKTGVLLGSPRLQSDAVDLVRLSNPGQERSFKSKASVLLGLQDEEPISEQPSALQQPVQIEDDEFRKITSQELARAFRKKVRSDLEDRNRPAVQQPAPAGYQRPYVQPQQPMVQQQRFVAGASQPGSYYGQQDIGVSPARNEEPAPLTMEEAKARWPHASMSGWRPGLYWSDKSRGWKTYLRKPYKSHKSVTGYEY